MLYETKTPFLVRFGSIGSRGEAPQAKLVEDAYVRGIMYCEAVIINRSDEVFLISKSGHMRDVKKEVAEP